MAQCPDTGNQLKSDEILLPGSGEQKNLKYCKVEIFLEHREVALLSPRKICESLNFSTVHLYLRIQIFANLLGDKNATYLRSKIISTLYIS